MTTKNIMKEIAALNERITRLEKSVMAYAVDSDNYSKEHISDIEDAICEMSEGEDE